MVIELLDIRIFKSKDSLKSISLDSFEGSPQISFDLPPITTDLGTVESIQGSTDVVSTVTTFLSSANFLVGIILGGSMQQLYGLIRAMQMILLSMLADVSFPAPTFIFF